MKTYNLIGYSTIGAHVVAGAIFAPPNWGFAFGAIFSFFYLLCIWFGGGLYLSDIVHMGIAHKTLDYRHWFMKFVVVFYNTVGIYINPKSWVNRHRHHHAFSDHDGDPNKLESDGFWRTMFLCLFPYKCRKDLAQDAILQSTSFRLVSTRYFAVISQFTSYGLLLLITRNWVYSLALWIGVRIFALWINMIQNYWTHERRFGTRRYDVSDDNAMNLGEWLPVTASFSASLQNNHHHFPRFLRTSHEENEYDFGFMTVRALKAIGLVEATTSGKQKPDGIALREIGF